MTPRETLLEAGREARLNSYNGMNRFRDALADVLLAEADSHVHIEGVGEKYVYDFMPGMENAPMVRLAEAYLDPMAGDE